VCSRLGFVIILTVINRVNDLSVLVKRKLMFSRQALMTPVCFLCHEKMAKSFKTSNDAQQIIRIVTMVKKYLTLAESMA